MTEFKQGQKAWNKGKAMTTETKKRISESRKGGITWNKNKQCPQLKGIRRGRYVEYFRNEFTVGVVSQMKVNHKNVHTYFLKGCVRRTKIYLSIEADHKRFAGYLYYNPSVIKSDKEAIWEWLKLTLPEDYQALTWLKKQKIATVNELYDQGLTQPKIFNILSAHDYFIRKKYVGTSKPIVYYSEEVTEKELVHYLENDYINFIYGRKSEYVKEGFKFQKAIQEKLVEELSKRGFRVKWLQPEARRKGRDGKVYKFDYLLCIEGVFGCPMTLAVETKNFCINSSNFSQILRFVYKVKQCFEDTSIIKILITKGIFSEQVFKDIYALGVWGVTTYERANEKGFAFYPKTSLGDYDNTSLEQEDVFNVMVHRLKGQKAKFLCQMFSERATISSTRIMLTGINKNIIYSLKEILAKEFGIKAAVDELRKAKRWKLRIQKSEFKLFHNKIGFNENTPLKFRENKKGSNNSGETKYSRLCEAIGVSCSKTLRKENVTLNADTVKLGEVP